MRLSELRRFVVVADGDPATLFAAVAERAGLVEVDSTNVRRVFLDTADGRFRARGTTVELRTPARARKAPMFVWSSSDTGETLASFALPDGAPTPRFVSDLPPSPATERLAETMEMRALLPQAEVMSRLTTLTLQDAEGKTTVRVVLDRSRLRGPAALPAIVELQPVRGYERDALRVAALLDAQVTLQPLDRALVDLVRDSVGAPTYLSSKLKVSLDPTSVAETAWRDVLSVLATAMSDNLEGTRADTDSEFLHDFRVAVRRTRSVLQEGRGVLSDDARDHWRQEFKWLGDVTTPTRDADVHLLDFPALMATLAPERAADLEPLHQLLLDHQRTSQLQLVADLASPRYTALVSGWESFLGAAWPNAGPEAILPAQSVAAARLATAWKRVVRDGRRIDDASPAEALHDLRKDAKRLRYLLECFGSLFDAADVGVVVKALKSLQDCLGEFQDTEVQAMSLAGFGDELISRGDATAVTLLAMGGVVEHLDERGRSARCRFSERFRAFDHPDTRQVFRRLIDVPEDTDR